MQRAWERAGGAGRGTPDTPAVFPAALGKGGKSSRRPDSGAGERGAEKVGETAMKIGSRGGANGMCEPVRRRGAAGRGSIRAGFTLIEPGV